LNLKTKDERSLPRTSRLGIIKRILECCKESSSKTNLVHMCNLSLSQLNLYQGFLVQTGLLEASRTTDQGKIFKASGKGKEFLRDYSQIKGLLETTHEQQ
jgi:predicted transcriptional regulator